MATFERLSVRSPRPFDVVPPAVLVAGFGAANEGVIGHVHVTAADGSVISSDPINSAAGFGFSLFDLYANAQAPNSLFGTVTVTADNPSGDPARELRVSVPVTFGDSVVDGHFAGIRPYTVIGGDTLFGIAEREFGDGELWPRLHAANRDIVPDPDVLTIGTVLRIPYGR